MGGQVSQSQKKEEKSKFSADFLVKDMKGIVSYEKIHAEVCLKYEAFVNRTDNTT